MGKTEVENSLDKHCKILRLFRDFSYKLTNPRTF